MFTDKEDITSIMMLALICIFTSSSIAMFAAILHQLLPITVELQYENELTV
ncbi:DUF2975 domain-containing protein [Lysinibacillus sp. FSL M8-0355]